MMHMDLNFRGNRSKACNKAANKLHNIVFLANIFSFIMAIYVYLLIKPSSEMLAFIPFFVHAILAIYSMHFFIKKVDRINKILQSKNKIGKDEK